MSSSNLIANLPVANDAIVHALPNLIAQPFAAGVGGVMGRAWIRIRPGNAATRVKNTDSVLPDGDHGAPDSAASRNAPAVTPASGHSRRALENQAPARRGSNFATLHRGVDTLGLPGSRGCIRSSTCSANKGMLKFSFLLIHLNGTLLRQGQNVRRGLVIGLP